jgi:hypothetical protein
MLKFIVGLSAAALLTLASGSALAQAKGKKPANAKCHTCVEQCFALDWPELPGEMPSTKSHGP